MKKSTFTLKNILIIFSIIILTSTMFGMENKILAQEFRAQEFLNALGQTSSKRRVNAALKVIHNPDFDPNTKIGLNNQTALHYAVYAVIREPELVKALIDKGANVNAVDNAGYTPLDWALQPQARWAENKQKTEYTIKLLKEAGAKTGKELGH